MQPRTIESLISIVELIGIALASFFVAPYVLTAAHYGSAQTVHSAFPIAIVKNGQYEIIRWSAYQKSPDKRAYTLVLTDDEAKHPLPHREFFTMKKIAADHYQLTYNANNDTYWVEYSVHHGVVVPRYFRFTGPLIVVLFFFAALIVTVIVHGVVKRYIVRRAPAVDGLH